MLLTCTLKNGYSGKFYVTCTFYHNLKKNSALLEGFFFYKNLFQSLNILPTSCLKQYPFTGGSWGWLCVAGFLTLCPQSTVAPALPSPSTWTAPSSPRNSSATISGVWWTRRGSQEPRGPSLAHSGNHVWCVVGALVVRSA